MTFLCRAIWMLPIVLAYVGSSSASLRVMHEWKYVDYVWKNNEQKQDAIDAGVYNFPTIIPFDIELLPDARNMITTPKFFNNPASLSIISNQTGDGGPLLDPYPDWSWHKSSGDCSGITSVNKVVIDKCNRLWIVDSGTIGDQRVCPAKILAFELENDELVEEFYLSDDLMRSPYNNYIGLLEIGTVELRADNCDEYWVYIGDVRSYGVVIYDGTAAWRIDEEFFLPTTTEYSIAGENFTSKTAPSLFLITPDGFLSEPYMLFKCGSNLKSFAATLSDLHNSKYGNEVSYYITNLTALSLEPAMGWSKDGILVTDFSEQMEIACWNLQYPLASQYTAVLEQNDTTLQYVSSIKFGTVDGTSTETMSIMSNRFQKYVLETMDFGEVNFRVLTADMSAFVEDTVCQPIDDPVVADSIQEKAFTPLNSGRSSRPRSQIALKFQGLLDIELI